MKVSKVIVGLWIIPCTICYSLSWDDLWSRKDQQGYYYYQLKDYEKASKHFQDPCWLGAATYKKNDFIQAAKYFEKCRDVNSMYNQANAKAMNGEYEKAISLYEKVLAEKPDHVDAQHNRDLLEQLLKQKKQEKEQSSSSNQSNTSQSSNSSKDKEQTQTSPQESSSSPTKATEENKQNADKKQEPKSVSKKENNDNTKQLENTKEHAEGNATDAKQQEDTNTQEVKAKQESVTPAPQALELNDIAENESKELKDKLDQMLRKVKPDPDRLLRQKFLYEHQQRMRRSME